MGNNFKILISAYACEPGRGSEGEIGWRLVNRLSEGNEVWVITRSNLREIHNQFFSISPKPSGLHFVYFDLPWIFRFYKKGARFFLLYYYLWQIGVIFVARHISKNKKFDLLHHLIGGMDWMPSGLAFVPGVFVWGPVGSENTCPAIRPYMSYSSKIKDNFRLTIRWVMRNLDPFVRYTGFRASVVLTHTPYTMPVRYTAKLIQFTQTGIHNSTELAKPKKDLGRGKLLRLVYAGELKDWKGASMALEASLIAFQYGILAELTVIGDGPLRCEMETAARKHPNGDQVKFLGKVPMEKLVQVLHDSDIMLYPSFHHGLATIVLQAMLTGLPVICIEGDATGRAVSNQAGVTIPVSKEGDPAVDIAKTILDLDQNEPRRQALAAAARNIALEFYSYDSLADRLEETYEEVLRRTDLK